MERIGIFVGSFDPFTIGHDSIVRRALPLFDRLVIGVGVNVSGASAFTAAVVFLLCVVGAILTFAPIGSMRKLVRQN